MLAAARRISNVVTHRQNNASGKECKRPLKTGRTAKRQCCQPRCIAGYTPAEPRTGNWPAHTPLSKFPRSDRCAVGGDGRHYRGNAVEDRKRLDFTFAFDALRARQSTEHFSTELFAEPGEPRDCSFVKAGKVCASTGGALRPATCIICSSIRIQEILESNLFSSLCRKTRSLIRTFGIRASNLSICFRERFVTAIVIRAMSSNLAMLCSLIPRRGPVLKN